MPRTALVTGFAGFLGRHYTAALRLRGWEVTGVDPFIGELMIPADHGYAVDCRDYYREERQRFDLIVHCAAVVEGRATIERHQLDTAINLELDAATFRYAQQTGASRLLYLSSAAVYPVARQHGPGSGLLAEGDADPLNPALPDQVYGWAKLTGELLAHAARAEGLSVTVVRPFSGYGTDQDAAYPFAAFIDRALDRADPFDVWGTGSQIRDFVHVDDVVAATLAMCDRGMPGPVNIGAGEPVSMVRLASAVCEAAGYHPLILPRPHEPRGVDYRVADITGLRGFYTLTVPLADGIARALEYRRTTATATA